MPRAVDCTTTSPWGGGHAPVGSLLDGLSHRSARRRLCPEPRDGQARADAGQRRPGDRRRQAGGRRGPGRVRGLPGPGARRLRGLARAQARRRLGTPAAALELPRGRRRGGQRLRRARRLHLRHARAAGAPRLRGRAGDGDGPRGRSRHGAPLGLSDQQGPARDPRPRRHHDRRAQPAAFRRHRRGGPRSAVPEVRPRRRAPGRRPRAALCHATRLRPDREREGDRHAPDRLAGFTAGPPAELAVDPPRPGRPPPHAAGRDRAPGPHRQQGRARELPPSPARDDVRRGPARGLLPRKRLLSPAARLSDDGAQGLPDPEHEAGGAGRQPAG